MKVGKHTKFMICFIEEFTNGEMDRFFFNLDYSAYAIEHFPYMKKENHILADRFAHIVDQAYEDACNEGLSDEDFKMIISNAFKEWLGKV